MSKKPKPYEIIEYEGDPARLYEDGSIRNERGHWLAAHPGGTPITHATAQAFATHRNNTAQKAKLLGLMDAQGLEVPDNATIEQLIDGAGSAERALVAHHAMTFLNSSNLRGMAESRRSLSIGVEQDSTPTGGGVHVGAVNLVLIAMRDALE